MEMKQLRKQTVQININLDTLQIVLYNNNMTAIHKELK